MISSSQAMSAGQAMGYFQADNYYIKDGTTEKGSWAGKGAESLGLNGEIIERDFLEALNGYKPGSLSDLQLQHLAELNNEEMKLTSEAKKLKKDGVDDKDLQIKIALYNEKRSDFHKDVKTDGLHSEIKELKKIANETNDSELISKIKALESELKISTDNNDFSVGDRVIAGDRDNIGYIRDIEDDGKHIVEFINPETKKMAIKVFGPDDLTNITREQNNSTNSDNNQMIRDGKNEHGIMSHRAGFDFTVSAPKSFSVMALVAGDERLIDVHHAANAKVVAFWEESLSQTRTYNENGERERTNSENLTVAQFTHYTSRATEKDRAPDPQLHTHNFIMNFTELNEKWMSLEPQQIYAMKKLSDQIYNTELARGAGELGYGIGWEKNGKNYSMQIKIGERGEELCNFMSSRTNQIDSAIKSKEEKLGRALTAEEKDQVTLSTRAYKESQDLGVLGKQWDEAAEEYGFVKGSLKEQAKQQKSDSPIEGNLEEAIKLAVQTISMEKSVFSEHELLFETLKITQGAWSVDAVREAVSANTKEYLARDEDTYHVGNDLKNIKTKFLSSKDTLRAEANIEKAVKDGKDTGSIMSKEEFQKHFESIELTRKEKEGVDYRELNDGQIKALEHIATSHDKYIAIQGDAGAGKTTALERMSDVVKILKNTVEKDIELVGLAPTGKAAAAISQEAGISSQTLDSFILKQRDEKEDTKKQQVFLIDESSMLDTKKMENIVNIAEKTGAKVVFIGDIKQLKPVGAGAMFERLLKQGMISFTQMTEVFRQQSETTKMMANAFKNITKLESGIEDLGKKNKIFQPNQDGNMNLVKETFVKSVSKDMVDNGVNNVIALVSVNTERHDFNEKIRAELIDAGIVSKEGVKIETLEEKRLNNSDKQFVGNYKVGDVLQAKGDLSGEYGDIKRGSATSVISVNKGDNSVKISYEAKNGETREKWVVGSQLTNFSSFEKKEKVFSAGDKIVFEKNTSFAKNGDTAIIKSIDDKGVFSIVKNGQDQKIDPKSYPYISHGYAMTTHKAQSQSINNVHIYADTSNGGLNKNAGYVQFSRAKFNVSLYTDSVEKLIELYKKEQVAENAGDYQKTDSFIDTKSNENELNELNFDKEIKSPVFKESKREINNKLTQFETKLQIEATKEMKTIPGRINTMRDMAEVAEKKASIFLQQNNNDGVKKALKASTEGKELRDAIKYQQLSKIEATIMSRGSVDLKASREYVDMMGSMEPAQKTSFINNQNRQRIHLNNMVDRGLLVRDKDNAEKYSLDVSRAEFNEYRQSQSSHEDRLLIAKDAWEHVQSDVVLKMAASRIDTMLISGGKWNPDAVITDLKKEGLYNKDVEIHIDRLKDRYEEMKNDGFVSRERDGSYVAKDSEYMKEYVATHDEIKTAENVKKKNPVHSTRSTRQAAMARMEQRLDNKIDKMTKLNFIGDISSEYRAALFLFREWGNTGRLLSVPAGLIAGISKYGVKATTRGVYKISKTIAKKTYNAVENQIEKIQKEIKIDRNGVDAKNLADKMSGNTFSERITNGIADTQKKDFSTRLKDVSEQKKEARTPLKEKSATKADFSERMAEAKGEKEVKNSEKSEKSEKGPKQESRSR